jgi:hypothetical protein
MLEDITRKLHLVSQSADSGISNALMSIRLCEEMLEAHNVWHEPFTPQALTSIRKTHESMLYLNKSFHRQRDWLTSYKARKDTAMNFVRETFAQLVLGVSANRTGLQHGDSTG